MVGKLMPLNPPFFDSLEPLTAKAMNTALYTFDPGNNFSPTGILFHANRPVLVEGLFVILSQQSNSTGAISSLMGSGNWRSYFDNSCLYGPGADAAFDNANGYIDPAVPGSAGVGGTASTEGGNYIVWGFPAFAATTNNGMSGALLTVTSTAATTQIVGGKQLSSTTEHNCSYALDVIGLINGTTVSLSGACADVSNNNYSYESNTLDYSSEVTRFYGFWNGVLTSGVTVTTVPTPPAWADYSTVSATTLNQQAIGSPFQLLNNPPTLRVAEVLTGTVPLNDLTLVGLGTAQIDTYDGWNATTHSYTVPVSGVYLVHGTVSLVAGSSGIGGIAAVTVNGSGTTFYGPAYSLTTVSIMCQVIRLLDLNAGDSIALAAYTSASTQYGPDASRLVVTWLSALSPVSSGLPWVPPDTSYRWQAGTSGTALTTAFQQHLTNDISFLLYKPYLFTYQTTSQTALSQNTYHAITMNQVSGIVHGSPGDSYSGWNAVRGLYVAPVNGWYLVTATYTQSVPASRPASCIAAIAQTPQGNGSPDVYQHICANSSSLEPGADAIGLYYLRAGDTVQPQYMEQSGGTFNTVISAGHQSTFSLVWLSE
jgi:hypothetical protein